MSFADLIAALLLPLPPWLGFWIFRRKGRVGLSYGYFLGGILAVLALPWAHLTGFSIPTSQLGGALFGFTLFLQAQREGVQGVRRLAIGVGGATGFLLLLLLRLHLPWQEVARFWAGAALESTLWLLFSDLGYRWAAGRQLEIRMPLVGAAALAVGALAQAFLPAGAPRLPWPAAVLAGLLLGLVALQQLLWLRGQGAWVEGRGQGLRMALALLENKTSGDAPSLSLGLDPHQAMWLVDGRGRILESNGPFSQQVGLPRHRLRGYALDALLQGGDSPAWEGLRKQLLQYGCASLPATQVSEDGTFRQVALEASVFDRGMALVWISDPSVGTLALRGGGGALEPGGEDGARRQTVNALLALSAAAGEFRAGIGESPLTAAVERLETASARLFPPAVPKDLQPLVDGEAALDALLPRLSPLLPAGGSLRVSAEPLPLAVDPDRLQRIATHLILHALERSKGPQLVIALEPVDLGGRSFGLLSLRNEGGQVRWPQTVFGLGWLRQAVQEAGGLLELDLDIRGGILPRIYLPSANPQGTSPHRFMEGRRIWVVDQDPLARETLMALVQMAGGEAEAYQDLRQLLKDSHGRPLPDLLVLERTASLDRFQRALRLFQKEAIPTLVLGMGQPLPVSPGALGLRRLGFLEKPFRAASFLESALALLRQPHG
ncbi:MAG: PAS domain-containing protein [Geothrix sp.]|nr:PAS domain-containing protein [Geothrix sp.]